MHRFQLLSVTAQTINAQLFENERIIQDKDGVGLYDGKEKTVAFDNGRIYLTTHRLIYLDAVKPQNNSRCLDLHTIVQTEHWIGFMKSSPKITLILSIGQQDQAEQEELFEDERSHASTRTWACHVCGYRNSATSGTQCNLCGVNKAAGLPNTASRTTSATTASENQALSPQAQLGTGALIPCQSCTFLNHSSMVRCEVCESPLGLLAIRASRPTTPSSRPATPLSSNMATPTFVRLSFRKGGDKLFYGALKKAIESKDWIATRRPGRRKGSPGSRDSVSDPVSGHRTTTIGIDGILRTIDLDARDREDDMQEALADLTALMSRAKEMVQMAQTLSNKIADGSTSTQTDENGQANNVVKRSLASLGLDTLAVTLDMMHDEETYHRQLAKELATVLLGTSKGLPIMEDGQTMKGLISLVDIWCLWNRARGVALVSPKDFKQACLYLPSVTTPQVSLRTFKSGLTVLHMPYFSESAFSARLQALLAPSLDQAIPNFATVEIAHHETISVQLAQEMIELLEDQDSSPIVRDEGDSRDGIRWQLNLFEKLEQEWIDVNFLAPLR